MPLPSFDRLRTNSLTNSARWKDQGAGKYIGELFVPGFLFRRESLDGLPRQKIECQVRSSAVVSERASEVSGQLANFEPRPSGSRKRAPARCIFLKGYRIEIGRASPLREMTSAAYGSAGRLDY